MPLTNSYNALGASNQQPEYQALWEPFGIDNASAGAVVMPTAAGPGAFVPGALLTFNTAGVGATPGPGGDGAYTVAMVDLAPVSSTIYLAGILLGVGALGAPAYAVPNTIAGTGPSLVAMVGKRGLMQVLVDNSTTIGHTIIPSTTSTHTGQCSDSGGTTRTYGTCIGVALQAVTVTTGPKLCWVNVNIP